MKYIYPLQKSVCFLLFILMLTSCDSLNEYLKISETTNNNSSSNKAARRAANRITPEYRAKIKEIGYVDSWAYQRLLIDAINSRDYKTIRNYIAKGANPNRGTTDIDGTSALQVAIQKGCFECIDAMASRAEFNYSYTSATFLPVVSAAYHSKKMLDYLLTKYKADVNSYATARYASGKVYALTALVRLNSSFPLSRRKEAIQVFLKHGASPTKGSTSAWYSYLERPEIVSPRVIQLFIQNGAPADLMMTGYGETTALGYLIEKKKFKEALALLNAGANPNYCNTTGNKVLAPMHWAIKHNDLDMVKSLVQHGANVNCHDYWKNKPGQSALSYAMKKGYQPIIDYLILKGAK